MKTKAYLGICSAIEPNQRYDNNFTPISQERLLCNWIQVLKEKSIKTKYIDILEGPKNRYQRRFNFSIILYESSRQ